MGNKLGGQTKQKDVKAKEDKKRDKDEKKDQDKQKRKDKKGKDKKKKKLGHHVSELDSDVEESSHVTGGDSESCVFHSAENVSVSPYLDSCTRSELEQGATWSGMFENHPSSQHPQVLTSKDFRDGFSLEACIPPDIARPETFDEMSTSATSRLEGHSSSSVKSRRSNNSVKSTSASRSRHATPTSLRSQHGDDASTASQTSGGGGGGYSTPLLSTPVFGRTDRCHSPTSPTSTLTRVQENDPDEVVDTTTSQSTSDIHHPHFYNHRHLQKQRQAGHIDFRNLPKPTSPHPQRRALSPKMTSSPFKMISSDDSSSSPSTPVPQRRAANLLDLFRSGSKSEKNKKIKSAAKQTATGTEQTSGKSDSSATEREVRVTSKPLWKTWERSSSKKSEKANKTASIFGTIRKTDGKSGKVSLSADEKGVEKKQMSAFEKMSGKINDALSKLDGDSRTNRGKQSQSSSTSLSSQLTAARDKKSSRTSSRSSDSNLECSSRAFSTDENKRNSSPPVAKSAAFCIMKLEELERSIEKTIREKFPDAEPFLLKKRSREELRGSRSLPTTPSLKKKLYVARDADDAKRRSPTDIVQVNLNGASARLSDSKGTAQYCDATYESLPSPAMSPVVLRRFGARTRHASISPKIQRAKTAALYNSPSELSRVEESLAKKTVTTVPSYHAKSTKQSFSPIMSSKFIQPLTQAQKSESKYDNVCDDTDQPLVPHVSASASHGAQLVRQECVDEDDSDEVNEAANYPANRPDSDQRPVIVPTFSAVFGSVSPKLKRHLQSKFQDIDKPNGRDGSLQGSEKQKAKIRNESVKTTGNVAKTVGSPRIKRADEKITAVASLTSSPVDDALESTERAGNHSHVIADDGQTGVLDNQTTKDQLGSRSAAAIPRTPGSPGQVSVKDRVTTFNKSVTEGRADATVGPGVNSGEAALKTGNSHLPRTGLPHNGTAGAGSGVGTAGSRDQGKMTALTAASHLSRPHAEVGNKSGVTERVHSVTSPASTRKHSTDHVVFGTAVALPCRLYACSTVSPTSPGPEVISPVSNSHTAHAPGALAGASQNVRYVKKEKLPVSEGDEKPSSTTVSTTIGSAIPTPGSITPVTVINCGASLSSAASVKVADGQSTQSGVVVSDQKTFPSDTSGDSEHLVGVVRPKVAPEGDQSSINTVKVSEGKKNDSLPSTLDETSNLQQPQQRQRQIEQQQQWKQQQSHLSQEDPVVHRQPLSLVISRLISEDKLEEEEEKQQQQQQQQQQEQIKQQQQQQQQQQEQIKQQQQQQQQQQEQIKQRQQEKEQPLRQSSPVSPDHGYKLVKPAIAMVTSFTYQQPCLTLEEKTVHSEASASVSLPSSPINNTRVERDFGSSGEEKDNYNITYESRNQEIQTDRVTKADKSVDSNGLIESIRASEYSATSRQAPLARAGDDLRRMEGQQAEEHERSKLSEPNDSDGSDFLRMVLSCKRTSGHKSKTAECSNVEEENFSEHVPPPSPTALEQLIEEFREEEAEEDSDMNEKKEIELALRRETEMKQFTEKIYKRLSDLLGSQSGDENDLDDEVFVEESAPSGTGRKVSELLSRLEIDRDSFSSDNEETDRNFVASASAMSSRTPHIQTQAKVLTIETSSSLTTTTSSDSDLDEASMGVDGKRKTETKRFVFPDFLDERDLQSDEARARRSSREYHSDDDVVAGRGIPDYYDDRPLWSRRQKPPGQLSAAMMAIRRRERRERWLKKRRRNKTDLLSTGSSDTGSEIYPKHDPRRLREDSNSFDHEEDEEATSFDKGTGKNEMGSGILVSPKYSKPILPFLAREEREQSPQVVEREREMKIACERLQSLAYRDYGNGSHSDDGGVRHRKHSKEKRKKSRYDNDAEDVDDEEEDECGDEEEGDQNESRRRPERFSSDSNLAIPGIEETFNELMSVQNILEGMQDKTPANEKTEATKYMPLTTENVRSVHEYYKDSSYAFGNGRRSRMSATDRTESDLDLYSENRDDGSSDSNMYADDEEDDEGNEPYTTADDDLGATGGSSSAADGSIRRGAQSRAEEDGEDSDENFVVSCTFYNSNALQQSAADNNANVPTSVTTSQGKTTPKSTSNPRTPVSRTVVNSDEEFWSGSAAIEESYRQLETAADEVSSTFQNAREQMHDIQHHLQALRRQMEVLQDDLTTTSVTLTPDMPVESPGKG